MIQRVSNGAATGVDGVFHIGPAFLADEAQLGLNMVEAAQRVGVRRFVFSSVIQPTSSRLSNHASKIPVEDAIYASGMEYIVLQPANFFQNLGPAWSKVVQEGFFGEPIPKSARIGRVNYRDVAEAVGIAFAEDRLTYGTFELCAGLMNREEIVAVMSDVLGKKVEAAEPDFEEWATVAKIPWEKRTPGNEDALRVLRDFASWRQQSYVASNPAAGANCPPAIHREFGGQVRGRANGIPRHPGSLLVAFGRYLP